jgi:hypothetical protein
VGLGVTACVFLFGCVACAATATAEAKATADPYGMTNKGTSNGNYKRNGKYGDPSPFDYAQGQDDDGGFSG